MARPPERVVSGDVLLRMEQAVKRSLQLLERATRALALHSVEHAVVGGHAAAAWVATVDEGATRNSPDVEILIRRCALPAAAAALEEAGFIGRSPTLFAGGEGTSPREVAHLIVSEEFSVNPTADETCMMGLIRVLRLDALVRLLLTRDRLLDRVLVRDFLNVGLVDQSWTARVPAHLASRLQHLLETPDG